MDKENRDQLETELLDLIEQHLKKVTPDHCDDDGIAACSYFLLGDMAFSDNLLDSHISTESIIINKDKYENLIKRLNG